MTSTIGERMLNLLAELHADARENAQRS